MKEKNWWVYMVRCVDGSLYTGTARDVDQRVAVHNQGKGAKYTRARLPVVLVYTEAHASRSIACQREAALKKLPRSSKLFLVSPH